MKILVTGGAGFIGRQVVAELLTAGHCVEVIDRLAHGQRPPACHRFTRMDLRDSAAVSFIRDTAPSVVIHLAGMAHVGNCESHPRDAFRHNATTTAHVVRALGGSRLILASTAAVYAADGKQHRESDSAGAKSVYGRSKLLSERIARGYQYRSGAPVWVLRLANVYGSGDMIDRVVPSILKQVRAGSDVLTLHDPDARRDFIYVDDVSHLICKMVDRSNGWMVLNVGSGSTVAVRELVEEFSAAAGRPLRSAPVAGEGHPRSTEPTLMDVSLMRFLFPEILPTPIHEAVVRMLAAIDATPPLRVDHGPPITKSLIVQ